MGGGEERLREDREGRDVTGEQGIGFRLPFDLFIPHSTDPSSLSHPLHPPHIPLSSSDLLKFTFQESSLTLYRFAQIRIPFPPPPNLPHPLPLSRRTSRSDVSRPHQIWKLHSSRCRSYGAGKECLSPSSGLIASSAGTSLIPHLPTRPNKDEAAE